MASQSTYSPASFVPQHHLPRSSLWRFGRMPPSTGLPLTMRRHRTHWTKGLSATRSPQPSTATKIEECVASHERYDAIPTGSKPVHPMGKPIRCSTNKTLRIIVAFPLASRSIFGARECCGELGVGCKQMGPGPDVISSGGEDWEVCIASMWSLIASVSVVPECITPVLVVCLAFERPSLATAVGQLAAV